MDLCLGNNYLQEMLRALTHRDICTIYNESQIWCRGDTSLLAKSRKALSVLNDARISYLIEPLSSREMYYKTQEGLMADLSSYLLYVACYNLHGNISIPLLPVIQQSRS